MTAIEGLSLLLYFDHNADPQFAADLRRAGFDAVAAKEVGLQHVSDEAHLAYAAAHGRVVFTFDLDDYVVLARRWMLEGRAHAGVIVSVQLGRISYGELLRRLMRFLDTFTAEEMVNRVEWLDSRWSADDTP